MRLHPKRDGFTLIELLITIVIISILAMIGITTFWRAKDRGLQATLQSDLKTAATQQEHYFGSHGIYASTAATLTDFRPSPGVDLAITYAAGNGWAGVTTHPSIAGARCGLLIGDAPVGSADPASAPGIVMCTH